MKKIILLCCISFLQINTHALEPSSPDHILADASAKCLCPASPTSSKKIECTRANGSIFKATQQCWKKKNSVTGKSCGTVCASAINVCNGTPSVCK